MRPKSRDDASRAPAPIIAGERGFFDPKPIQEVEQILRQRCLLPGPDSPVGQETCWTIAAQIGNKNAAALFG